MIAQFRRKVAAGWTLILGLLLVGLVVRMASANVSSSLENTFFLPSITYDFTDLQWTDVGIPGIAEHSFEIDANQSETIYLSTYGNAWRSIDSGQSWKAIGDGLPIRQFATATVSPTVLYAEVTGGLPNQIYRSIDAGDSWQGLSWVHHYRLLSLAVNPITPTEVYVGAGVFDSTTYGGEVYKSTNGGISWIKILPSFTMAWDIVFDPLNPKVIYLGSSARGLLKSEDGGDSWQEMNNGLPGGYITVQNIHVHPDDPQIVYITADGQLYRSSDGGGSWERIGTGLPVSWLSTFVINPESPDKIYALPGRGNDYYGVYQSHDGGYSWQHLAPNPISGKPTKIAVQVGEETNLFVMFEGYGLKNGGFWKLTLLP